MGLPLPRTLKFRLTLACALIASATAALCGVFAYLGARERLVDSHRVLGRQMAEGLARTAAIEIVAGDRRGLFDVLQSLASGRAACYAAVFDPDGAALATWSVRGVALPPSAMDRGPLDTEIRVVELGDRSASEFDAAIRREARDEIPHAPNGPQLLGTLRIGLSREPIVRKVAELQRSIGLLVLLAAIAAAALSVVLVRICFAPLERLVEATRRIARGDFEAARDGLPPDGELGALGRALARMSRWLAAKDRALRRAKLNLERKIEARTRSLSRALNEARVAERTRENVLACISHELRTPLASIRAFAEILLHHHDEPAAVRSEFVSIILAESDRLSALVSNILDYVKFLSGDVNWVLDEVDLPALSEQAAANLRPLLESRGMRVTVTREGDPPTVRADRDKILRAISNLLSNAIKFSPPAGVIEVTARPAGDSVMLTVRDHGVGIPEEEHEAIFERFHQGGDLLRDKPPGAGLGLPLTREIIGRHGGTVRVESAPGQGAAFHVVLPRLGPSEDDLRRSMARIPSELPGAH